MDQVTVLAPASVSNVVCGFDCLGFALVDPCDVVTVRRTDGRGITLSHNDNFDLPTEPEKNVAGVALQAMIGAAGLDHGFAVELTKRIKPGSGIGSSAASSCGAVVAANILLGRPFTNEQLVRFAMEGERLASGAKHADNVAPCIFGGFTLVRSTDPLDVVSLRFHELFATVIHPQIEIKTSHAREILPSEVPLKAAIEQWSNLGSLVAGLSSGDYPLIARSLVDVIVEPVRSSLIPKFEKMKSAALAAGALGGGISGSGPSVFMLSRTADTASKVEQAMRHVFSPTGIEFLTYVGPISGDGVRQI